MSGIQHSLKREAEVLHKGCNLHFRYYKPLHPENATKTPLVVLHGGPGASHGLWYDALCELADDRPALFYDQRGSHYSPCDFAPDLMSAEQFAEDLDVLVSAAGLEKFCLLGHSFGGAVALTYMDRNKDKVSSLILSSPLMSTEWWEADTVSRMQELGYNVGELFACEREGQTNLSYYQEAKQAFEKAHGILTEQGLGFLHHFKMMNRDVYQKMWGASEFSCTGSLKGLDKTNVLSSIDVPTLFIYGEYDSVTGVTMEKAASMISGVSFCHSVKNAGHLSFLDNRPDYIKAVCRHLAL